MVQHPYAPPGVAELPVPRLRVAEALVWLWGLVSGVLLGIAIGMVAMAWLLGVWP